MRVPGMHPTSSPDGSVTAGNLDSIVENAGDEAQGSGKAGNLVDSDEHAATAVERQVTAGDAGNRRRLRRRWKMKKRTQPSVSAEGSVSTTSRKTYPSTLWEARRRSKSRRQTVVGQLERGLRDPEVHRPRLRWAWHDGKLVSARTHKASKAGPRASRRSESKNGKWASPPHASTPLPAANKCAPAVPINQQKTRPRSPAVTSPPHTADVVERRQLQVLSTDYAGGLQAKARTFVPI